MNPPGVSWARFLLRLFVGAEVGADLEANVAEEFAVRREASKSSWNGLWYWREILVACALGVRDRTRDALRGHRRGAGSFDDLRQDVRYALRSLSKNPAFAFLAILILALGIGLNSAMLSVVRGTLLRPLPFPEVDELRVLSGNHATQGLFNTALSAQEFFDLEERTSLAGDIGIYRGRIVMVFSDQDVSQTISATFVNSSYFDVLGLSPLRGRTFLPSEDVGPGSHAVAVVSHSFWMNELGGDPEVVGSSIELSERSYTVVGVLSPEFRDVAFPAGETDVWLPMMMAQPFLGSGVFQGRGPDQFWGLIRLSSESREEAVHAELNQVMADLDAEIPGRHPGWRTGLTELGEYYFGGVSLTIRLLLLGAGLVLLVCCVNVAAMLMTQAGSRRKELTLRLALGADRRRIIRQLLTESIVLAFLGGAIGVLITFFSLDLLLSSFPLNLPAFAQIEVDLSVLFAVFLLLGLIGVIFGLVPAVQSTRAEGGSTMELGDRGESSGADISRSGWWIVTAEIAMAAVLLVGFGLTAKSLGRLSETATGYDETNLFSVRFNLASGAPVPEDPQARAQAGQAELQRWLSFARGFLAEAEALPEVEGVALWGPSMLGFPRTFISMVPEGLDPTQPDNRSIAQFHLISPGALDVVDIPLIAGREFAMQDRLGTNPVAVVDRRVAERLWPGEDPIGRRFHPWSAAGNLATVVGVAENVKHRGRLSDDRSVAGDIYLPYLAGPSRTLSAVLRVRSAEADVTPAVRDLSRSLDPTVGVFNAAMMEERLQSQESAPFFAAVMMGIYALIAGLLAFAGIYGVLSYVVRSGRREIAIRAALGASRETLLGMVFRRGMIPVYIGLSIGLLGALLLSGLIDDLLFQTPGTDFGTYAVVSLLVLGAAGLASFVPAFMASRLEPMEVLRSD